MASEPTQLELGLEPLYIVWEGDMYFRADPNTLEPQHTARFGCPLGGRRMDLGEWQLRRAKQHEAQMYEDEAQMYADEAQALRAQELERMRLERSCTPCTCEDCNGRA